MKTQISSGTKVTFENFLKVEPEDLIAFSKEYLNHVSELMKYLTRKRQLQLCLKRINPNGSVQEKMIHGFVSNIDPEKKSFEFFSGEDFYGNHYEEGIKTFIRTDNVLGLVPLLPNTGINPYKNSSFPMTLEYFRCLEKMKRLLNTCVGIEHMVTLFFRFNKANELRRNGNFFMETQVLKVNKSNVEIKFLRSSAYVNEENFIADIVPRIRTVLFTTPERYLSTVRISSMEKPEFNPHDDED